MKNQILTLTVLFLSFGYSAFAQNGALSLHLPHFAGDTAYITAYGGKTIDTIASIALDKSGNGQIGNKLARTGLCFLLIKKNSVNFPFIWSVKENQSLTCSSEYVYGEAVKFGGSAENDSVIAWNTQKKHIQDKQMFWHEGRMLYAEATPQNIFIEKELAALQQQSDKLDITLNKSELFAAKYLKIKYFVDKYSPFLGEYEQDSVLLAPFRSYYLDTLDIEALYASDMWFKTFSALLMVYRPLDNYQRDGVFIMEYEKDFQHIYRRIADRKIRSVFASDVKEISRQLGREFPLTELIINDLLPTGSPAPTLTLKKGKEKIKNTLLIFYESGCNNCENELNQLIGNYPELKAKGIRVISIAADIDKTIYETNAARFPWSDKYCDFNGLTGDNFRAYYAIGTPTIFAINKNGKITGRYARFADYLNEKLNY
jgi:peroxiredoxin